MKILITGATGFIGKRLVKLLEPRAHTIYLLTRKESWQKTRRLFACENKYKLIEGDILSNDVCSKVEDINLLSNEVDHVVHLAAKYDLEASAMDAYSHNVIGVQNMLALARQLKRLEYFHHVSTYAVNGVGPGLKGEEDLLAIKNFPDHYSKSKNQGERLVRTMPTPGIKKRVYRPGIVVGDSSTGEMDKVDGPYYLFKFLHGIRQYHSSLEKLGAIPIPFGERALFPIIPVDVLAEWMAAAIVNPSQEEEFKCYHFINEKPLSLKKYLEMSLPAFGLRCSVKRVGGRSLFSWVLPKAGMPKELLGYMFAEGSYAVTQRQQDFPELQEYDIAAMAPALAEQARKMFEQEPQ